MDDISGKIALVTGASQGLGRDIALELARLGSIVLVNCFHNPTRAEAVAAEITAAGGRAEVLICDITNEAELAERVASRQVDILVNNARLDPYKRPEGLGEGEWFNMLLNVNLTGAYLATLAVAPGMKERKWGRILNLSSAQAYIGMRQPMIPYSVSKVGLLALTRCFAKELGDFGVTVNSLAPGLVMTENIYGRLSHETVEARLRSYPLHRAPDAHEVAEVAVNTLRTGAMTGEVVNINSGVYFPA